MRHKLKLFTLLFFFCLTCFALHAQQKHFIYVQSEDKQPFAVVLSGKVYSSSDYGYVIVPKLNDGTYNFTISFPLNKFPDQAFTCTINKKDAGYMLKNSNNGWALENMQTKKVILNNTNEVAQKNAFGDMLSEVVSDSELTKKNIIAEEPVDTLNTITTGIPVEQASDTTVVNSSAFVTDSIIQIERDSLVQLEKIAEAKADTGTNMMFVDKTQTGVDTISVFVPAETTNNITAEQKTLPDSSVTTLQKEDSTAIAETNEKDLIPQKTDTVAVTQVEPSEQMPDTANHAISNPFFKPEQSGTLQNSVANESTDQSNKTQIVTTNNAVKQDCGNMISDEDLNKIKRKMFVQSRDNEMIQYAVKSLAKKCITTEQVKTLGSLFSSDDGRYSLYDALYNYVYDYGNYGILANQILDPYYKKRFAALLR